MLLVVCQLSRDVIGYEDLILSVLSLTSLLKSPSIDRLHSCDQQPWKCHGTEKFKIFKNGKRELRTSKVSAGK